MELFYSSRHPIWQPSVYKRSLGAWFQQMQQIQMNQQHLKLKLHVLCMLHFIVCGTCIGIFPSVIYNTFLIDNTGKFRLRQQGVPQCFSWQECWVYGVNNLYYGNLLHRVQASVPILLSDVLYMLQNRLNHFEQQNEEIVLKFVRRNGIKCS